MYIDGEMPAETMKERIEAAAAIYGDEVKLYAYNRDDLGPDAMPPLNKPEGQTWLWREIEAVKPDVIIFDSMMCLLVGPLSEEETWAPCLPLIRQLSARRIAQVWLNHTGHDATRSFGTKTKEWEFDGVILLSKHPTDDTAVLLQFTKARLRTPKTAGLFKPQLIRRAEHGWTTEAATVGRAEGNHRATQAGVAEGRLPRTRRRCCGQPRTQRRAGAQGRHRCDPPQDDRTRLLDHRGGKAPRARAHCVPAREGSTDPGWPVRQRRRHPLEPQVSSRRHTHPVPGRVTASRTVPRALIQV